LAEEIEPIEDEPVALAEEIHQEPEDISREFEEPKASEVISSLTEEKELEDIKNRKLKDTKKIFRSLNFQDQLLKLKDDFSSKNLKKNEISQETNIQSLEVNSQDLEAINNIPILQTNDDINFEKNEEISSINDFVDEIEIDESQNNFLSLIENKNIICISPPGHGKTATGISAVEKFLEISENSRLQNIYFLTFTKAATREVRKRLKHIDPYQSIRCFTIDSFAGQLNQLVKNQTGLKFNYKTYDESIEIATKFVTGICDANSSNLVRNHLNDRIHLLVIDEAQDINDIRNKFMKSVLNFLNKDCRILVFGDPVQEIYTFQNNGISETFLNYAKTKTYCKFISHELKINHRVKSKKLLNSFKLAREIYKQNISAKYKNKKLIDHLKEVYKTPIGDQKQSGSVFLFRRNIDVLNNVLQRFNNRKRSAFRISYLHEINEPFLAFIIKEFFSAKKVSLDKIWLFLEKSDIQKLESIYDIDQIGEFIDKLEDYYGDGQENIEIQKIIDDFEDALVPEYFSTKTWGKGKNIFSSIHSYKGREAKDVVLNYASESSNNDDEEFRVYYVALTRAVENLRFREFNSEKVLYKKYYGKREYLPNKKAIALGHNGDIVWSNEPELYDSEMEQNWLQQDWLANHAKQFFELEIIHNKKRNQEDSFDVLTKKSGKYLGCLSFQMKEILKKEYGNNIPSRFKNVFMVGTTATFIEQFLPDEEFNKNLAFIRKKIQNKPKVILKPNIIGILEPRNG